MSASRFSILALLLLSACVGPPTRAPRPTPPVVRTTAPPPPVAPALAADAGVTPGGWAYRQDARGAIASFGQAGAAPVFTLRCDRGSRRMFASAPGAIAGALTISASTMAKAFAASPAGGSAGYLTADITPTDPILDAAAFSRGRFTVTAGAAQIVMPTWPEVARVIEDCRG